MIGHENKIFRLFALAVRALVSNLFILTSIYISTLTKMHLDKKHISDKSKSADSFDSGAATVFVKSLTEFSSVKQVDSSSLDKIYLHNILVFLDYIEINPFQEM